jgi:hypothetical protein
LRRQATALRKAYDPTITLRLFPQQRKRKSSPAAPAEPIRPVRGEDEVGAQLLAEDDQREILTAINDRVPRVYEP